MAAGVAASDPPAGGLPGGEPPLLPPAEYVALQPREAVPPPAPESPETPLLTLADVEAMALACNPAIAEAAAQVRAAQGECLQVGLPPNPTLGYLGSEIGNDRRAGQQGLIVGQEFVRGHKLQLNRAVECREVLRLQQRLAAQQERLLTDVRISFYDAYLAQRRVALARDLQTVGRQSVATADNLLEAAEGRRTDVLQAEIESQRADADLAQAESNFRGAWRRLAVLAAQGDLPVQPLSADVESLRWNSSWEETRARLLSASPEVAEAAAAVEKARYALARAAAEPIPNLTAEASVQYDHATNDTIAGAQLTLPIPLWNKNQGGIARAQAELSRRRSSAWSRSSCGSSSGWPTSTSSTKPRGSQVESLHGQILDRARQNLDIATQGYRAGELGFLDFLTVQRTYFQMNLAFLTALGQLNQSVQMLQGLLLAGSYEHAAEAPLP